MALELKLSQKLSQSLVMTPQLQQAIKLLQLGRQEYLEVIERELLENPVLEDAGDDAEHFAEGQSEQEQILDKIIQESTPKELRLSENPELIDFYNTHAESLSGSYSNVQNGFDDTRPSLESTLGNPEGLSTHLLWQLRTSELADADKEVAMLIVGNLDRNGYLDISLEEISMESQRSVESVERVLEIVQTLDPAGIAARDLRECLLIQLEQIGEKDSLAWQIVDEFLHLLEARKVDDIARNLGVSIDEVALAVSLIRTLEPRPGRPFLDETPIYITPDVYVKKIDDDYVVMLNDNGVPRLKLSPFYQKIVDAPKPDVQSAGSKEEHDYLQEKLKAAAWLIKSIEQRQQTIFKVTQSIVAFQKEFFEQGVAKLRPLVLREVAEDVGLHESTVSRVTTNKYVHTPQGVFELKFFFTSGLSSDAGQVSSESVKERIREMIAAEDPKKPLSDQAIAAVLKKEGVDIARRTVAKYREMLNILSSSRRKSLF